MRTVNFLLLKICVIKKGRIPPLQNVVSFLPIGNPEPTYDALHLNANNIFDNTKLGNAYLQPLVSKL